MKRAQISVDEVIADLLQIHDRCMKPAPILDRNGRPTGVFEFDASNACRSLELLGKLLGMFKTGVEHSGPEGKPIDIRVVYEDGRKVIAKLERLEQAKQAEREGRANGK